MSPTIARRPGYPAWTASPIAEVEIPSDPLTIASNFPSRIGRRVFLFEAVDGQDTAMTAIS
jgi:hypothetical protein